MKKFFTIALSVLFAFGMLMGCSKKKEEIKPIVIYDGQFSEMKIIHQMVKMLVEIDKSKKSDDELDAIAIALTAFAHLK